MRKLALLTFIALLGFSVTGCLGPGILDPGQLIGSDTYDVAGRVVDDGGQGIPGVSLSANPAGVTATSDSDGRWNIEGLTGTQTITAAKTGYTFTPESVVTEARVDVHMSSRQVPAASPTGHTPPCGTKNCTELFECGKNGTPSPERAYIRR